MLVGYYYEGIVVCIHCANQEEITKGEKIYANDEAANDLCCICGWELTEVFE